MTTAASKPPLSFKPEAMTQTSTGAPTTPSTQVIARATNKTVPTALTRSWVAWSPCWVRLSARMGTKACEKAPSANRRRSRLGMRNATLKASVVALAPKAAAISSSRTRPVMRDARVSRETMDADLSRLIAAL